MTLLSTHHRELVDAVNADSATAPPTRPWPPTSCRTWAPCATPASSSRSGCSPKNNPPRPGMQARIQYQPLGVVGVISP